MGANVSTPYKRLGAWLARVRGTIYQAPTDGIACGVTTEVGADLTGKTDSFTPPLTKRQRNSAWASGYSSVALPVKKNDYWKIDTLIAADADVWWIPLEP